jgi:hypothetical protein
MASRSYKLSLRVRKNMTYVNLRLMAFSAALLCATSGCLGSEAEVAAADLATTENYEFEPSPSATHMGPVSAKVDENDGYCEDGLGVFLSATADTATLTVYVVTPAERSMFERPTLRLTLSDGDSERTVVREFATITLEAGDSSTFSEHVDGTLMNVDAELDAQ